MVFLRSTPHPVTVTTRIITFLVGNPYKPSFATVTGWGVDPRYSIRIFQTKFSAIKSIAPRLESKAFRLEVLKVIRHLANCWLYHLLRWSRWSWDPKLDLERFSWWFRKICFRKHNMTISAKSLVYFTTEVPLHRTFRKFHVGWLTDDPTTICCFSFTSLARSPCSFCWVWRLKDKSCIRMVKEKWSITYCYIQIMFIYKHINFFYCINSIHIFADEYI